MRDVLLCLDLCRVQGFDVAGHCAGLHCSGRRAEMWDFDRSQHTVSHQGTASEACFVAAGSAGVAIVIAES